NALSIRGGTPAPLAGVADSMVRNSNQIAAQARRGAQGARQLDRIRNEGVIGALACAMKLEHSTRPVKRNMPGDVTVAGIFWGGAATRVSARSLGSARARAGPDGGGYAGARGVSAAACATRRRVLRGGT